MSTTPDPNEITRERLVLAFNEWMRRYIAEPSAFEAQFETIADFQREDTPGFVPSYGHCCVALIDALLDALGETADCTATPDPAAATAFRIASPEQARASVDPYVTGVTDAEIELISIMRARNNALAQVAAAMVKGLTAQNAGDHRRPAAPHLDLMAVISRRLNPRGTRRREGGA